MKVILLKDVPNFGRRYEVKNVSDGHALNFLFPRGLAELANDQTLKKVEELKKQHDDEKRVREDLLVKNLKALTDSRIELSEKANDKGHLFAGIHKPEIIAAIKKQTELDVDADHLDLEEPIKAVGEYDIKIKVQDKEATFKLIVNSI
ncbi:MAG TPA: 50S ribosomal protein L9 [Candidatus Paceibacterota bacterium]|nr:50S ribosomal protein L9 [Candidatus Paceibacterota bacterium]